MPTLRYNPKALRSLRVSRQLTTDGLERLARVSARAIRAAEAGAIPKADTLGRLAAALGVGVEAFYQNGRRA